MQSVNPTTGAVMQTYAALTAEETAQRVERSAQAYTGYRRTSFAERAGWLRAAAAILERDQQALGRTMTLEMGKPLAAAVAEAGKCAWACRHFAEHAAGYLADEPVETSARQSYVRYLPLGPILAVMPWNFPFWQLFRCAAPALMAGNTMLLKHASNVPQCALAIEQVFAEAGFPEGVFQTLLVGSGAVAGLLADPRIAAASLTGSEQAGIEVGVAAARQIKKVVLELGGSDPFVVMPSADLEAAVAAAVTARVQNNGQSCIAAKRFIVAAPVAEEFTRRFVARMAGLRVGDPLEAATEVGPLSSAAAVRSLDEAVRASVAAGARLLTGGEPLPGPGSYYPPTVLTDIPPTAPAYREELFGPVACLFTARDLDDAIRLANDTRFGLGASVWTQDGGEQARFIAEIEAGLVAVNQMVASDPRLPFGGVKRSGLGRELGGHGIREFTNIKTISIQ